MKSVKNNTNLTNGESSDIAEKIKNNLNTKTTRNICQYCGSNLGSKTFCENCGAKINKK